MTALQGSVGTRLVTFFFLSIVLFYVLVCLLFCYFAFGFSIPAIVNIGPFNISGLSFGISQIENSLQLCGMFLFLLFLIFSFVFCDLRSLLRLFLII